MNSLINKFNNYHVMDSDDILDITSRIISEYHLEEYLKDIKFNDDLDEIAVYGQTSCIIYINMKRLWTACYNWANKLQAKYKIDDRNYSYLLNYYCLYILFHEITHAVQKKKHDKLCNDTNSAYIFLYELCELLEREEKELYENHHDLFPMEIEANNNGLLKSYNFISHTNLPNREKRILHSQYLTSLIMNYDISDKAITTPFNKLYNLESRINILKLNELLEESPLDKIERLNLGLDITRGEYKSLQKEKVRLLIKR